MSAQEKRSFWDHGVGKLLKTADDFMSNSQENGVDTNYIRKCDLDRMFYVGYYGYFQQHDMTFPVNVDDAYVPYDPAFKPANFADNKFVAADMHSYMSEVELGIDWRGLTLELPITLNSKYNLSLGLAKTGSVWGARIRYKSITNLEGELFDNYNQALDRWHSNMQNGVNMPVDAKSSPIQKDRLDLKVFFVEGYYVFNHKRFSLAAGIYGDMVQKRSSGSVFLMANYYQSTLGANSLFNHYHDTFRNWKISIGPGYGYNYALMGGKLCIHTSVIPMISLRNHLDHKGNYRTFPNGNAWQDFDEHYYDAVDDGQSRFVLNGFVRMAASYSYNRMLFNILANYRQYLYRNNADTKINNREADVQINVGYRF